MHYQRLLSAQHHLRVLCCLVTTCCGLGAIDIGKSKRVMVSSVVLSFCWPCSHSRVMYLACARNGTYDHRLVRTGHPVRSAILKHQIGRSVVGWVTTSESLLLYVSHCFAIFWSNRSFPPRFSEGLGLSMRIRCRFHARPIPHIFEEYLLPSAVHLTSLRARVSEPSIYV